MSGTERHTTKRGATPAKPARDARDATATQGDATPLIELRNVSKRFGERPVGAAAACCNAPACPGRPP